ncbi:hypothetical protein CWE05_08720 [Bifidobacterium longum]|uniref:Uncharacterized protein n=1 Tax=Bifidobacterium longum TaxID=216816 RepID=A0A2U2RRB3_BIFLN|nr:hypothetical protein CWE05_08720 [Bifidobacterium longum]
MIICLCLDKVNITPASLFRGLLAQGFPGRFAGFARYWSHMADVWHYVHQVVRIVDGLPSTVRTLSPE